ncbi:phage tail assembly chaperone [uncultured Erythrobacter sp.]|uniref:phage tail assembly chaperone n=1 Tax=uncultured Erythrobacter sp. TaxID=263913 RepID=UPI00262B6A1C|nr:phage tail assembly chaperone [uncultured Erythrobacter sp.]
MNEVFGQAAQKWWSLSARLLGWRPNDFWQATPAELIASLRDPTETDDAAGPSRERIAQMMERDSNG